MIFNRNTVATAVLCLGLSLQVSAHAAIAPALGVSGNPVRNDVQRPQKGKECGNIDITKTFDSSTAVQANANGTFDVFIANFNAGVDGSRQVTVLVDPTGTGKSFVSADVLQNGDKNPSNVGLQQLVVQLPSGAACTGGASKDKCLVSFTTAGGFGNCIVVEQGKGAAKGNGAATSSAKASASSSTTKSSVKASATKSATKSSAKSSATSSATKSSSKASASSSSAKSSSTAASSSASTSASQTQSASATSSAFDPSNTQGLTLSQIDAALQAEFNRLKQEIEKKIKEEESLKSQKFHKSNKSQKSQKKQRAARWARDV